MAHLVALRFSHDALSVVSPGRRKGMSSTRGECWAAIPILTSSPPRFDDLNEEASPRYLRWLVVSIGVHLIILGLVLSAVLPRMSGRTAPPPDGIAVTLVDPFPSSTQSGVSDQLVHQADPSKTLVLVAPSPPGSQEAKVDLLTIVGAEKGPAIPTSSAPEPPSSVDAERRPSTRGITANLTAAPPSAVIASRSPAELAWEQSIVTRLERRRYYPEAALRAGVSGVVMLRLVIGRDGKLLAAELVDPPGVSVLERTALTMASRASPYPPPPTSMDGDAFRLLVPVEFAAGKR